MIDQKHRLVIPTRTLALSVPLVARRSNAAGRSFEECQAYAISLGIPASCTGKVNTRYLRYKAAGTAIHPRGVVTRCMAGRS